jgi:hypothetical protein
LDTPSPTFTEVDVNVMKVGYIGHRHYFSINQERVVSKHQNLGFTALGCRKMLGQGTVSKSVSVSTKTCLRARFRRNRGHGVDTVPLLDTFGHGCRVQASKPVFFVLHEQPNSPFAAPVEVVLAKFAAPMFTYAARPDHARH